MISCLIAILGVVAAQAQGATRKPGIDVSRFNQQVDWRQVAGAGIKFAFVQASRGAGDDCEVKPRRCGADSLYDSNYAAATANGIRVGAYHRAFATGDDRAEAKADARAEAAIFVNEVDNLHRGDLLPALDVETPFGGLDRSELRVWVRTWLTYVERKLAARPIIYTNVSSWAALGDTTEFADAGHRLWVANFDVDVPLVPADNWAGRGWSIWQFTSSGSVAGVEGRVDRNVLRSGFRTVSVRSETMRP